MSTQIDYFAYILNTTQGDKAIGAAFSFPIDWEEFRERLGFTKAPVLSSYEVRDCNLPYPMDYSHMSIDELNQLWRKWLTMPLEIQSEFYNLLPRFPNGAWSLLDIIPNLKLHADCKTALDLARKLINWEQRPYFPPNLRRYFKYEAYAQDLEANRKCIVTPSGVFEYRE